MPITTAAAVHSISNGEKSKSNSCENLRQYCLNSSLHGLRYIGTSSLSAFERIFFGISFSLAIVLATYFISNIWQKWNDSPVIISGNPISTNIADIPFPAFTICNMNQVKKSFAKSLREQRDKVILDSICTVGDEIKDTSKDFEGKWSFVKQFLVNASQPCNQMIRACRFGMRSVSCEKVFASVLTDEGLCCTFNAIHPKLMLRHYDEENFIVSNANADDIYSTWEPESGYQSVDGRSHYPRNIAGAGAQFGLSLLLDVDVVNYYCSSTSSYGFKALLHSPIETPKITNFGFFISPGVESKVTATPKISEATDLIRRVPMQQRQCVFANENNLSYYRIYTKKNCESECVSKLTEENCGCTLYFMPRNESKICSRLEATCYEEVIFKIQNTMDSNLSCNHCLPACFEINYGREISSCPLGTGTFQTTLMPLPHIMQNASYIKDNIAIVHVALNENAYSGNTKNELIGFVEFLSYSGGLVSLFMGFSVISLVEIIYFLTLRPYCAAKRAEADENEQHQRVNVRGYTKTKFINHQHINDHYRFRSEMYQRKSTAMASPVATNFCGNMQLKLNSGLRRVKQKFTNAWTSFADIYKDDEEPPYPYFN